MFDADFNCLAFDWQQRRVARAWEGLRCPILSGQAFGWPFSQHSGGLGHDVHDERRHGR